MSDLAKNNFDRVAWCYDRLSSLVFGNAIRQSQIVLFEHIKDNGEVLIIGGGTGWMIRELLKVKNVQRIDYIESSKQMLEKSRSNSPVSTNTEINFIHGDENNIPQNKIYDAVIACYFLDVFGPERINDVLSKLVNVLKPEGKLLVADFAISPDSPLKHKLLLKIMYLFFSITCRLETQHLTDFRDRLKSYGLVKKYAVASCKGFILSEIYSFPT